MTTVVSLVNMKGGVGKTTLCYNFAWWLAYRANLRVLAVDLDPQSNLSQYFMGATRYLDYISGPQGTVVDIFEQFSAPHVSRSAPAPIDPERCILPLQEWKEGSLLHLVPSRLELAWTLKNPTEKAHLLPKFLAQVAYRYDVILIDCAPTESILTNAAYRSSRFIVVPVKPEFLATIGMPLLARSLGEFRLAHGDHDLDVAGIVFNDADPHRKKPEHNKARRDVRKLAADHDWYVFESEARHSDSYATGSRAGKPIFQTSYARHYVTREFDAVAKEFLGRVGLTVRSS